MSDVPRAELGPRPVQVLGNRPVGDMQRVPCLFAIPPASGERETLNLSWAEEGKRLGSDRVRKFAGERGKRHERPSVGVELAEYMSLVGRTL